MTAPASAAAAPAGALGESYVLPMALTNKDTGRGPVVGDDRWDLKAFLPRTTKRTVLTFDCIANPGLRLAAKQFLASRLNRAVPVSLSALAVRPMKLTTTASELSNLNLWLRALVDLGVTRLRDVRQPHLELIKRLWQTQIQPCTIAGRIATLQHLAAHSPFLDPDRLTFTPWAGRPAAHVAMRVKPEENSTPRIPEHIMAPLLRAALFYVESVSADILAAADLARRLDSRKPEAAQRNGDTAARVTRWLEQRRASGQKIPSLPAKMKHLAPDAAIIDGVVQAPHFKLIRQLAGVGSTQHLRPLLEQAGRQLGYQEGGLDCPITIWPDSGQPWRAGFNALIIDEEIQQLRTAAWIVIAYLSGMRDAEVRELRRDCAYQAPGQDGRLRYKLRGRVLKGRKLSGDEAEWVVLEVVHKAVEVLKAINDDPTHLFGYVHGSTGPRLISGIPERLNNFRDHANRLFGSPPAPFIPPIALPGNVIASEASPSPDNMDHSVPDAAGGTALPWAFNTRQFRRTLAWHIAHQPFGVVAGAKQYKHEKITVFEGYAGSSQSGFAAEVAAEEQIAALDYVEDLYRDWHDGGRTSGGAASRIDTEFERIRSELGDLPGVIADEPRLRAMLTHLTKTLHPGVRNDCFFHAASAVCVKKANAISRPLPMHTLCLKCPNARRSSIHRPRLIQAQSAAAQFQQQLKACCAKAPAPPLQLKTIDTHLGDLTEALDSITKHEGDHKR